MGEGRLLRAQEVLAHVRIWAPENDRGLQLEGRLEQGLKAGNGRIVAYVDPRKNPMQSMKTGFRYACSSTTAASLWFFWSSRTERSTESFRRE